MEVSLGRFGFTLTYGPKLPPDAQPLLQAKAKEGDTAAFGLTPGWAQVPHLVVKDLRRAGIDVPAHWGDTNWVYALIHGMAFYITPYIPTAVAASFSMKGVNLRTGMKEDFEGGLTDDPCQSYWHGPTSWIDGYVPSHGEGVRQFVPLRGDQEMAFDVARAVGVDPLSIWLDSISAAFHVPVDLEKLQNTNSYGRGVLESTLGGGFESMAYSLSKGPSPRRALRGPAVEEVGMGAGAVMRQRHPEDPSVTAEDFLPTHLLRMTARLVWDNQFNMWARESGADVIPASLLNDLERRQAEYERYIWSIVGGKPRKTNVDSLPTLG